MMRAPFLATALLFLVGCAGHALPYKPEQQPAGARVSAGYILVGDQLRIEIDTDGHRLEEAKILRADGSELHPHTIEHAAIGPTSSPVGVGIGIGGGRWGGHGGVGVGTGVTVGIPVGGGRVAGHTVAYFPLAQAGPAPWRLRVKLVGIEPTLIVVGVVPQSAVLRPPVPLASEVEVGAHAQVVDLFPVELAVR
jgi:hypothetical protein